MEVFIDHYIVLGLPSGEEGFKISEKEITKAYRLKALELHPDKRRDDPNAVTEFQRLQSSYEILKDEHSRRAFDADLASRKAKIERKMSEDEEREYWRMMSKREERRIMKILLDHEKRDRIRMIYAMKERKRKRMRFDLDDRARARLMNNLVG